MIRPIHIRPVLNGFVVSVGCQEVVYNSVQELVAELEAYLKNPEKTEKRYLESSINAGEIDVSPNQLIVDQTRAARVDTPEILAAAVTRARDR